MTMISVLLGFAVQIAPLLGVNFGADDAALVNETVDKLVSAVLFTTAAWGRIRASTGLTLLPK